jgi:pyruvate dehydrogenase E2 component (dihydrolipoamide acetyltransferase)
VSNLGGLGVEQFTPILNPPQVGILGVGSIFLRPEQRADGAGSDYAFLPRIGLSLTIDHQGVDGAPGAVFLRSLAKTIADFDLLLML